MLKKITDYLSLIVLAFATLFLSALLYIRYLWPQADFESIMITIREITPRVIIESITPRDYALAFVPFVIIFPLCYVYLNLKHRLFAALVFTLTALYLTGYPTYFVLTRTTSTLYEEQYANPEEITFTFPKQKRNLILIYLESFEQNFANKEFYEQNLIPNLKNLQNDKNHAENYQNLPGATYSIAAIVASHCGIPLRFSPNRDIYATHFFLPQAVCFPEILRQNGYQTTIVKAADITFTQADLFAKSHGYEKALGVDEILKTYPEAEHPKRRGTFGGVSDETLFDYAQKELKNFDKDKPFLLTLFTLDTHTPTTHRNPECKAVFNDKRDAFLCTDQTVAKFISWLKTSPYWENTTIVLQGDHLLPSRIPTKGRPKRAIYNAFLNLPENLSIDKNKPFSSYDMAPSILESLNIKLSARAFGLGRSLFSQSPTLAETLDSKLRILLPQQSKVYDKFLTPRVKRAEIYAPYTPSTPLSGEAFLPYTDAYEEVLGQYFLDRLNLQLPQKPANGLTLKLSFNAMINYGHQLKIIANDTELLAFSPDLNTRPPYHITIDIPSSLLSENKLRLIFRNDSGVLTTTQMGIAPVEMILTEK